MRPRKHTVALSATLGLIIAVLLLSPASRLKAAAASALQFDGLDDRVVFGTASGLGAQNFTLELWFMRQGSGVATTTGSGGVTAVPLITKGMAEIDAVPSDNRDMNYFLGIEPNTRVLVADFEDKNNGLNHPVKGKTAICDNVWYHAAATYDSATGIWRLYLNGELDVESTVTGTALVRTPRFDSIQHAALGTALQSNGAVSGQTQGFFKGRMNEARIWSVARSQAEILGSMGVTIPTPQAGLLGRWGLDDGSGTSALNTAGVANSPNGSLLPLNVPPAPAGPPVWVVPGTPFSPTPLPAGNNGLKLTGTTAAGDYIALEKGPYPLTGPTPLGTATFTVETLFRKEGPGAPISTGTGGHTSVVPLVTKGRGELEGSNVDFNYFLGINVAPNTDPVIVADFEEGAAGANPGLNHPISGATKILDNTWYHAAVTYDGLKLQLYLNGSLERSIDVGQPPRADSIQPAALGSALNSTGLASGFFAGTLDETRIWNYARTQTQVNGGRDREISNADGLLGRWSYNERCGCVIDSTGHVLGSVTLGAGWSWVSTPALSTAVNMPPTVDAGPDKAVTLPASATLDGLAADDGVNTGVPFTAQWSKVSGPGTAFFTNAAAPHTDVSFSATGTYVLRLTASDGDYSVSDTVTVTADGVPNTAPVVDAGADQAITLPVDTVALAGTITDDGGPAPVAAQWSKVSGPGPVTFANVSAASTTATFSTEGSYVLRLTASDGMFSSNDTLTVTVNANLANRAIQLGGTNAYVTFGPAPHLGASAFTLETWMRRDGAGTTTNTGNGGVVAVPLIAKGMAESEGGTQDANYFLGIDAAGKLAADFEDTATGGNHPVTGVASLPADSRWHHVAATYDGTTWRLYIDGHEDKMLEVGAFTPRFDSIDHATIGTALNSTGVVTPGQQAGFFNGVLDEVRIWSYPRTAAQIVSGLNREIPSATGLLGRWGLNEGAGTAAGDSSGGNVTGSIVGSNWSWVSGAHITGAPNAAPSVDAGTDQIVALPSVTMLMGSATDDALTGTTVTTLWSQVSGPGVALFGSASNAVTTVDFTALGTYVLRLTASDGELSAFDEVQLVVGGIINQPPVVDAGADQTITLPHNSASLSGIVTDDGILPGGAVTTQWSKISGPGTVAFADATAVATTATFSLPGAYVLRLSATDGVLSSNDTLTVTVNSDPANKAIRLDGTNAYVTFGAAPGLGAAKFTIETWFRRDGPGIATFTGTGGITAVPLITKGMAEVDQKDNRDMNYFLGIRLSDGVLIADFEDNVDGTNHPIVGVTPILADGQWRHAAATYDGTVWRLYLNGVEDANLTVGNFTPRADSIQHAAIGTALNSTGGVGTQTQGFFHGALDEARVWNYARSLDQISRGRRFEITVPVPGLLGRWGLNEGSGTGVADTSGAGRNGTVVGLAYSWVSGAPFVDPGNHAPVAAADDVTTNEDSSLTVAVLANDTDADADVLALTTVGAPGHGTATANANGTVTYTPASNFNGTDSFSYAISDAQGGSASATVNVTVNAVNDAPHADNDNATTNEDTPVSIAVLANDTDADGGSLTPVIVAGPANGSVTVEANGAVTYVPAANFHGADSFTYSANDGTTSSNVATVTIAVQSVNDAPSGLADAYSVDEDGMLVVPTPGVLENDVDADGDPLSTIVATDVAHGSLTLNADGSLIYTPNANFHGVDTFTYLVSDGTVESAPITVTITVTSENDAPVAANDAYSTNEDTAVTISAAGVLANDSDVDGDALQAVLVVAPTNGTLTLNADGSFTYTPNANFNGSDTFTYLARDGSAADSNVASVVITVNAVNDAPAGVADSFTTSEDTALTVAAPGVLANDTDTEGSPLSAVVVSVPAHGTLALNADGGFTYTPTADFHGTDSFTYKASDEGNLLSAETTVTITVDSVNDAPTANDDAYSLDEDTVLTFGAPGVLANDSDLDGTVTAVLVSGATHGNVVLHADGSFVYTPDANFHGVDSFAYRANDGELNSGVAQVAITVTSVSDVPVAHDDVFNTAEDTVLTVGAPGVLGNDVEGDGEALTAILVAGPAHGTLTLNADGSFTYTPAAQYSGSDSFTYQAADGSADSNLATVTIAVSPVADSPVAANDSYTKNEDVPLIVVAPGVLGNDRDADNDPLTAVLVSGPANGTLVLNPDGSFVYTSASNTNGNDSFTYVVTDGTLTSAVATVTINVNAVNDPPVAGDDAFTTMEDTPLTVAAPGLLANDFDVDSTTLKALKASNPAHGTVVVNANGSFTYTPAANYSGPDSFTYRANDGSVSSATATVSLTVMPVPDAPIAASQAKSLSEDTSKAITLTATDADGNPLTFAIVTPPAHGSLTGTAPNVTYVPAPNYNGTDSFTFTASDGALTSNVATVSLTITSVNDAPVAVANSYSTTEDTLLSVAAPGVLANDTDVEGSPITAVKTSNPGHGTVTLNSNGSFTYMPSANYAGPDSFTYRVNDGSLNSPSVTVSLTVNPVNDAPVANPQSRSLSEDGTRSITLTGSDTEGSALTFTIVTPPSHGTLTGTAPNVTYVPTANFNGADSFTFRVSDGSLTSNVATVSLTINSVNDAPVAQPASYTTLRNTALNRTLVATDVDQQRLTYSITSQPTKGSVVIVSPFTGEFIYTPAPGKTGSDSFKFRANDGTTNSNTARIDIQIQ